jgi:leader peptidase (prepilin peptidase)/N-methyltransferase
MASELGGLAAAAPPAALWFWGAVVFLFGAVAGSFLNVCIHRWPREQSIVRPASHCPKCGKPLRWYHNLPLLSWLALRGRCAFCGECISVVYPAVEFLNAALWVLLWLKFGWSPVTAAYMTLVSLFLVGMFVDFEHCLLPDEVTIGGTLIGFLFSAVFPQLHGVRLWDESLLASLFGAGVGGGLLYFVRLAGGLMFGRKRERFENDVVIGLSKGRLRLNDGETDEEEDLRNVLLSRRERLEFNASRGTVGDEKIDGMLVRVTRRELAVGGRSWPLASAPRLEAVTREIEMPREAMGMGDVKLMMAIGAFCGWQAVLFSLIVSSLLGSLIGLALIAFGQRQWGAHIPYGPYIVGGVFLWIFYGPEILRWYLGQMGLS